MGLCLIFCSLLNTVKYGYISEDKQKGVGVKKGTQLEYRFFGIILRHDQKTHEGIQHEPFETSLWEVMGKQNELEWNPTNPSTDLSRQLFELVSSNLPVRMRDELKLYCSLGSVLDHIHGVDGFFLLGDNPSCRITFDLSTSVGGKKEPNADMVILGEELDNDVLIKRIAAKIAGRLLSKIRRTRKHYTKHKKLVLV